MNRMKKFSLAACLAGILIIAGAGCEPPQPQSVAVNEVIIEKYAFSPKLLTVKKGTTVTWTNKDIAKHTVTGKNGGPASALFGQGESYSYTFDTAGTFDYFCEPHPYMTATVEVTE